MEDHAATLAGLRARAVEAKMRAQIAAGGVVSVEDFNVLTSFAFRNWNADAVGTDGSTAMIMTCTQGSVEDVRGLLAARADPTLEALGYNHGADAVWQAFPLAAASEAGHPAVVRLLLAHDGVGPQQVTTDRGRSALPSSAHVREGVPMRFDCYCRSLEWM